MNQERLMQVLVAPHLSEKASAAADTRNQHVFRVLPNASKAEIKSAVEMLFNVKVDSVRVVNLKGKRKRFGYTSGRRADRKKAYVRLRPGHDIQFAGE